MRRWHSGCISETSRTDEGRKRLSFVWFLAIMGACEPGWVTLASDECTREKERYDGSFNRIRAGRRMEIF